MITLLRRGLCPILDLCLTKSFGLLEPVCSFALFGQRDKKLVHLAKIFLGINFPILKQYYTKSSFNFVIYSNKNSLNIVWDRLYLYEELTLAQLLHNFRGLFFFIRSPGGDHFDSVSYLKVALITAFAPVRNLKTP